MIVLLNAPKGETKKQKIKALTTAKAIEAVDDAADVPIQTLMGHLKPLAHIKGVQQFREVPEGPKRWTIYMFGSKYTKPTQSYHFTIYTTPQQG